MAKRKNQKIKKHIFKIDDLPENLDFSLIGIQTKQPLYKLVFDFNKIFETGFYLNKDIIVVRKKKNIHFENYVTKENNIGQKMYFLNNEIQIPVSHPNMLFATFEAYYLFPEFKTLNYLMMLPNHSNINLSLIKQHFKSNYPINWIEIDLKKCATAFPVFPS